MGQLEIYNTAMAASASAGFFLLVISLLWFFTKDIKGAIKLLRTTENKTFLSVAAERRHAMKTLKKRERTNGPIETITVANDLVFHSLTEIPEDPWPPIPMRLKMEARQAFLLKKHLSILAEDY